MILYIETNFILELAYEQKGSDSCKELLADLRGGTLAIVLPVFCLAEPLIANTARAKRKKDLVDKLNVELTEISRTTTYARVPGAADETRRAIVESIAKDKENVDQSLITISASVETIPLTDLIFTKAIELQRAGVLKSPQDAIVLASVLSHLTTTAPGPKCFVTTNSRDFASPEVEDALAAHECKLLFKFEDALGYSRASRSRPDPRP